MFTSDYDKNEENWIFEIFRGGKYDLHLWILYDDLEKSLSTLTKISKSKCTKIPVTNSFFAKCKPIEWLIFQQIDSEPSSMNYFNNKIEINLENGALEYLIENLREAIKSGEVFPSEVTELSTDFGYEITLYVSVGY